MCILQLSILSLSSVAVDTVTKVVFICVSLGSCHVSLVILLEKNISERSVESQDDS
jgi:hypothetical protein